jgi:hypothetical protein
MLSFELFGTIPDAGLLAACDLRARLDPELEPGVKDAGTASSELQGGALHFQHTSIRDNRAFFQLLPSLPSGAYSLKIWAQSPPENCYILDLTLRNLEVCEELPLRQHISCVTFRTFAWGGDPGDTGRGTDAELQEGETETVAAALGGAAGVIEIQEERGLTMGSHVWDSAVVVFHLLPSLLPTLLTPQQLKRQGQRGLVAVELGAGVGLTGLQLARLGLFSRVFLTDLAAQVPLTQQNIALNAPHCHVATSSDADSRSEGSEDEGVAVAVTAVELDWLSADSLESFRQQHLRGRPVDLITAADVLYSPSLAAALFAVLRALATPGHTVVLLAQKLRGEQGAAGVDVAAEPGLRVWKLREACGVLVYKIMVEEA